MARRIPAVLVCAMAPTVLMATCRDPAADTARTDPAAAGGGDVAAGAELFAANCAVCHGPQAEVGPMPPIDGVSDQDVADIVAWVTSTPAQGGHIE